MLITEAALKTERHTTFYLTAGPDDGPLIIFVHGWPELSLSWRNQLAVFGGLGFHAVAPDMRGYGRSTVYDDHSDYAQAPIVDDTMELLDHLRGPSGRAIWVGHDWGSPVVWNIAAHHPERCHAVANLCVPYDTLEHGVERCFELVDRAVYPEAQFPAGQWDYQLHYQEQFAAATASMDASPYDTVKLLFRKGDPAGRGKPAATALTRANGGWFGGGGAPDVPRDGDVVSANDLAIYASALTRNGFFGPNSYYMNHDANAEFSATNGNLEMPVLFIGARYDFVCETVDSNLAEPMRAACAHLTEAVVDSGHWMAQERPVEVNAILAKWLATSVAETWPA